MKYRQDLKYNWLITRDFLQGAPRNVNSMPEIAIIGGSGLYSLLDEPDSISIQTPYGMPSSTIDAGKINGIEVAFIPRHGKKHTIPPHMVNYRANIWALSKLKVKRIIAINAVGSLREEYRPGDILIPDQFIDYTRRRELTFYDGPDVYHISMADPFCPDINSALKKSADRNGYSSHLGGSYACIEGPRFSTRSESRMFRQFSDIIGMTLVPEINLAAEKAMCYSTLATITDYDVWADEPVDTREVIETMKKNEEKVQKMIKEVIPEISGNRKCECSHRLDEAKI